MANELGINIKANVDLGDINQQLENTAQKFSQMTGSIGQGGQLKIDTGKFVEQMNSCNAAMEALHKKIAEQTARLRAKLRSNDCAMSLRKRGRRSSATTAKSLRERKRR